jgi:hypothetical protein
MSMKTITPAEIEQAAAMCVTNVRKGVTLSSAVHALGVIRNWENETCKEIERRAGAMLKKKRN